MKVNRLLTNICSNDLPRSKIFFTALFDFKIDYDSDWFVHLISADRELEIGITQADHDLVPTAFRGSPVGMYITLVVENVDQLYRQALEHEVEILSPPSSTFYGQKRCLLSEPSGALVDVSSPE